MNGTNRKTRKRFAYPNLVGQGGRHHEEPREAGTIQNFFENTYRPLRLRDGSFRTTHLYRQVLARYAEYLGHPPTFDDFDDLKVSAFLCSRLDSGKSPWTVDRERSSLLALWRYAARRGLVARWPEVPPGKTPKRAPEAWTIEEMQRIFHAAESSRGWVNGVRARVFWPALIATLYETGERITAVLGAKRRDFHPPHLLIRAEVRKGSTEDKVYTLSKATCKRVIAASKHDEPEIFHWDGCHSGLWGAWKRIVQRAGLPIGRGSGFHKIRRTAASHYAAAGGDATEFLGHSNPALAKKWYLDPSVVNAGKPQPCDVLPPIDR